MIEAADFQRLLDARLALDDDDLVPDDVICFTFAHVMHILGVSRTTLNRLVQRGLLGDDSCRRPPACESC